MSFFSIVHLITIVAFILYGLLTLFNEGMEKEFERLQIPQFKLLVGVTQLVGAGGLLCGWWLPWLGVVAAGGLCLQMIAGIMVRTLVKDNWVQAIQAALFALANGYLVLQFFEQMG